MTHTKIRANAGGVAAKALCSTAGMDVALTLKLAVMIARSHAISATNRSRLRTLTRFVKYSQMRWQNRKKVHDETHLAQAPHPRREARGTGSKKIICMRLLRIRGNCVLCLSPDETRETEK